MAAQGYIGRAPGESSVIVARQTFTPTGITTNFTFASGYTVGYVDAYLNGARLIEGDDYTATDGSVVGLTTHAISGDVLELVVYKAFNVSNVVAAKDDFSVPGDLSVTGTTTLTGTLTVGGVEVQPGAAGTWASYDTNTGISTTKKVKIQNNLEVTGAASTFSGNLTVGGSMNVAGTLTYEDVTNSETPGITTTGGLVVTGLGATFGSGVGIADSIYHIDDSNTAIRFPATDTFTVETAGSERLRINSSGNVSIGGTEGITYSLLKGLAINVDNGDAGIIVNSSSSAHNAYISFGYGDSGAVSHADQFSAYIGRIGDDTLILGTANQQRLRITSTGNVGVSTLTPRAKLSVSSGTSKYNPASGLGAGAIACIESNGNVGLQFLSNSSFNNYIYFGDESSASTGSIQYSHGANALIFRVNGGTERVRIANNGEIGLGGANYGTSGQVLTSNGSGSAVTWEDASGGAGITTQAGTASGIVTSMFLNDATDHKVTATGICTITTTQSGTEGQSHTIRIVNSGIATVGFSTYFLFPSGSAPVLPIADGAVSLISFTVHDSVGAGCTQLLAGASLNFS